MAESALSGTRSDVPAPRARTPSPIREVAANASKGRVVARDFDVSPDTTDVIYAEDEEVFRETAVRELLKCGYLRENIYEADNGLGALDHLARMQNEGNVTKPLLVLLDVRMPGMDGRECALQIQELVKKRYLHREPFVVCISSIHRQVEIDEGGGNFQIVLPKPINTQYLDEMLDFMRKWWTMGLGRELPAWKEFNPECLEVIAADDEPTCRLSSYMAFVQAGVQSDSVQEVDEEEALIEIVLEMQEGDVTRPLVILLGNEAWAPGLKVRVDELRSSRELKREPFVVCTSVNSDRIGTSAAVDYFHAFLPRTFAPKDVKWCLEYCRLWWLTRGTSPYEKATEGAHNDDSSDPGDELYLSEEEDYAEESD
eukprot:TRINITY_DN3590_c3_g1_i1.p1 TRINITY_DN3590_c3_g1~~TRINITY_DN3590_c3_g1_i1.p1  ORF type:complete len:393 (+),score=60.92 TRINITY_DN3590_c3_g1_i1:71-1180(+)